MQNFYIFIRMGYATGFLVFESIVESSKVNPKD